MIAPLRGLVLIGGKSRRMGRPKEDLHYHDKIQKEFVGDLLSRFCCETFYSVAFDDNQKDESYPVIKDVEADLGPLGGVLSAFVKDRHSAWMVVACDLPYVDSDTLSLLLESRDPNKFATCFYNQETNSPEPLISIWEPKAYKVICDYKEEGELSPRKILLDADANFIPIADARKLRNVNTPEEREAVEDFLKHNSE